VDTESDDEKITGQEGEHEKKKRKIENGLAHNFKFISMR